MAAVRLSHAWTAAIPGSGFRGCRLHSLTKLAAFSLSVPSQVALNDGATRFPRAISTAVSRAGLAARPLSRCRVGCCAQLQQRRSSGAVASPVSTANRVLEWLGFLGFTKFSKSAMRLAGMRLYICATEYCDYRALMDATGLPDTFNSWFMLTELHVWLIMVRLAGEGKEGRFVRNQLVYSMWEDVDARSKKILEGGSSGKRREGIETFSNMFKGALFAYDEGLLSDDRVLAAALWRNMFDMKASEPQSLELMVEYVRKQLWHIEKQDSALIVSKGLVTFLPFNSDTLDIDRTKHVKNLLNAMR